MENYKALKYKVQELIESKTITFSPNGPNVNNNLMRPYNKPMKNMLEKEEGKKMVSPVDDEGLTIEGLLMKPSELVVKAFDD